MFVFFYAKHPPIVRTLAPAMPPVHQAECGKFHPPRPLCLPPMPHDDTVGFSLTHLQSGPAESASSSNAGGDGRVGANGWTMTGNDLSGRSLAQAQLQAVTQGVSILRMPTGTGGARGVMHRRGVLRCRLATVRITLDRCDGQVRGPKTETFDPLSRTIAPDKPGCA
jgi:hypothetical protein